MVEKIEVTDKSILNTNIVLPYSELQGVPSECEVGETAETKFCMLLKVRQQLTGAVQRKW